MATSPPPSVGLAVWQATNRRSEQPGFFRPTDGICSETALHSVASKYSPAHAGLAAFPLLLALSSASVARAASMVEVNQSEWAAGASGLPTYVNMFTYVPDQLASKPAIVVAPHHCQGTAQSTYSEMASLVSIADKTGFVLIFPEATGQNCWDAGSSRSLSHGGRGDTGAIVQMVKYALGKHGGDATRVYSVGGSSGGIMTEALLGVYPEVFMAGVSLMGVPCGCWAQGYNDVTGNGSSAQWSGSCAGGNVTKTGQAWGDLVRSYYPGYAGRRPRLQHWHGTADTVLNFKNMAEDVKQWTNVLGLDETPSGSDMPKSGTTRQFWKSACGFTVFETFALSGVAHAVPFDGQAVAAYFGLATSGAQDPEAVACGSGMGGTGGAGGMGGTSSGGKGGDGTNLGGAAGRASAGGGGGGNAGGGAGSGGGVAAGGSAPMGAGGTPSGGVGTGGSLGAGGTSSAGGLLGSGGQQSAGGAMTTSGGAGLGVSGSLSSGGSSAGMTSVQPDSSGCACNVAGRDTSSLASIAALALAVIGVGRRRTRAQERAAS